MTEGERLNNDNPDHVVGNWSAKIRENVSTFGKSYSYRGGSVTSQAGAL